ncbi:MAG: pentapeptide repeat-containing protein [Candidatus Poribacteria bacterium]|nr:pentapeptide repeat-containing protein [Candidatus Poribacteria bacterium]
MKVRGTDGKEYTIEPRADLSGTTNLRGANLYRANLTGASLANAYLIRADLTNANLSGAVWNDGTVFPEGFEIPDELRG